MAIPILQSIKKEYDRLRIIIIKVQKKNGDSANAVFELSSVRSQFSISSRLYSANGR